MKGREGVREGEKIRKEGGREEGKLIDVLTACDSEMIYSPHRILRAGSSCYISSTLLDEGPSLSIPMMVFRTGPVDNMSP